MKLIITNINNFHYNSLSILKSTCIAKMMSALNSTKFYLQDFTTIGTTYLV
jgi:hypothetical protein